MKINNLEGDSPPVHNDSMVPQTHSRSRRSRNSEIGYDNLDEKIQISGDNLAKFQAENVSLRRSINENRLDMVTLKIDSILHLKILKIYSGKILVY